MTKQIPKWSKHLHTWGEAGIVTIKNRVLHPKEKDQGITCMFIGYPHDHPAGTLRMYDPETNKGVHIT
jgi:hypothetical protein